MTSCVLFYRNASPINEFDETHDQNYNTFREPFLDFSSNNDN